MPKIQKGLSDAEMLKGYVEDNTVHMYDGNSTLKRKVKEKRKEIKLRRQNGKEKCRHEDSL